MVEAQDGGLLIMARDGVLWAVPPEEQVRHTSDDALQALRRDEMGKRVLAELPAGFDVHQTAHYLIFYNTSPAYAQWCGSLFERLYLAFTNYWSRKGFELHQPEFPLVAIIFADKQSYCKFAQGRIGRRGRVDHRLLQPDHQPDDDVRPDGHGGVRGDGRPDRTAAQINRDSGPARRPAAPWPRSSTRRRTRSRSTAACTRGSATARCGSARGSRCISRRPTCTAPGLAGHRGGEPAAAGAVPAVLAEPAGRLAGDPDPRRQAVPRPKQALDAYAEAWALTYFLIRQHPKEYVAYLAMLSQKKPLIWDTPDAAARRVPPGLRRT